MVMCLFQQCLNPLKSGSYPELMIQKKKEWRRSLNPLKSGSYPEFVSGIASANEVESQSPKKRVLSRETIKKVRVLYTGLNPLKSGSYPEKSGPGLN